MFDFEVFVKVEMINFLKNKKKVEDDVDRWMLYEDEDEGRRWRKVK